MLPGRVRLAALGEETLLVTLGDRADEATLARVQALHRALALAPLAGVGEIVPAFAALAVGFDAERVRREAALAPTASALSAVARWVRVQAGAIGTSAARGGAAREQIIPVCYGGEYGPDLAALARAAGLSADEAVQRHAGGTYVVAAVGFAPGFPYLLGLDPRLHTARHATPRRRVPAGSVGIGGAQTGIYPQASPGGWQLIGRTPWALFGVDQVPPARLAAGDRVRFQVIEAAEFAAWTVTPTGAA